MARDIDVPDSATPEEAAAIVATIGAYLDAAAEHAPGAEWVLCYHGTEDWDLERVTQSVGRGTRFVEDRRPS